MSPPDFQSNQQPRRPESIGASKSAGTPPLIGGAPKSSSEPPPLPAKAQSAPPPPLPSEARGSQAAFAAPAAPGPLANNKGLYAGAFAVILVALVIWVFSLMGPAKPVQTKPIEAETHTDPTPAAQTVEAPIDAKTPAEWVAAARISAVRMGAGKLIANGRIYALNESIPPFGLRWTGKKETELTFVDATGKEYRRAYGQSFNSDPSAPPPAPEPAEPTAPTEP